MKREFIQPTFYGDQFTEHTESVASLTNAHGYQLAARFEALGKLRDGWLDGRGVAPNKEKIAQLAEFIVGAFPENVPLPAIVPTPEGNLLLEWSTSGAPSIDIDLHRLTADFHSLESGGGEIERQFTIASSADWLKVAAILKERIADREA